MIKKISVLALLFFSWVYSYASNSGVIADSLNNQECIEIQLNNSEKTLICTGSKLNDNIDFFLKAIPDKNSLVQPLKQGLIYAKLNTDLVDVISIHWGSVVDLDKSNSHNKLVTLTYAKNPTTGEVLLKSFKFADGPVDLDADLFSEEYSQPSYMLFHNIESNRCVQEEYLLETPPIKVFGLSIPRLSGNASEVSFNSKATVDMPEKQSTLKCILNKTSFQTLTDSIKTNSTTAVVNQDIYRNETEKNDAFLKRLTKNITDLNKQGICGYKDAYSEFVGYPFNNERANMLGNQFFGYQGRFLIKNVESLYFGHNQHYISTFPGLVKMMPKPKVVYDRYTLDTPKASLKRYVVRPVIDCAIQ